MILFVLVFACLIIFYIYTYTSVSPHTICIHIVHLRFYLHFSLSLSRRAIQRSPIDLYVHLFSHLRFHLNLWLRLYFKVHSCSCMLVYLFLLILESTFAFVMTAERKVWRQVALMMSKDETVTISSALKPIQDTSKFWAVEIDEFCVHRQVKGSKRDGKHHSKGKVKSKFDKPGKGKGGLWGKGKGLARANTRTRPKRTETSQDPNAKVTHLGWAKKASNGQEFCKKFHAFNRFLWQAGLC